jgi:hypothetical protein
MLCHVDTYSLVCCTADQPILGGQSLYELGLNEDLEPVLSVALTQLLLLRPNSTAFALHATCGDEFGGL